MMKIYIFIYFILSPLLSFGQIIDKVKNPVDWVNPLIGTNTGRWLSNGNLYPVIGVPWGMNLWTPQTGKMDNTWIYTYNAHKIKGFRQTHETSVWLGDYGTFSMMPITGKLRIEGEDRASWFSHKTEICKPYFYKVYLGKYDVTTEFTPTKRAAQFSFTFPQTDSAYLIIDAFNKGSYVKILPEKRMIIGYNKRYDRGEPKNLKNYFVLKFDKDFELWGSWDKKGYESGRKELAAEHAIAVIGFKTKDKEKIGVKVASSFISFDQAKLNLKREVGKDSFEQTEQEAKTAWNKQLSKIEVGGGTAEQIRTFYSCLYRTMIFPMSLYEKNKEGQIMHWSPFNGEILPGYLFAGTGFWDTFRSLYPLLTLVSPDVNVKMQKGLINAYKEGGALPEWSTPGYGHAMVGNNSASVVASAYLKGLQGYDIETLYEALVKGANNETIGRKGVLYYNKLGYVPYDVDINESGSRTLEYAYDDFAIYQLGKVLGKPESETAVYAKHSQNYRHLFDPSVGMMRGKRKDGTFQSPFNPFKWGGVFTEGNSWQYTWEVFHDVQGLIDLMGGEKKFNNKLDSLFNLPPVFDESYYGSVIHEIREMQVENMGQYAHGNEPGHQITYLYNYSGEPWKTQYLVREIMDRLYNPHPDGYPGDDDNGAMSAWYVFSAIGFYPVCPACGQYVLGSPLFKKVTLHLADGKKVQINAPNNNNENRYIKQLKVNEKRYSPNWISHKDLVKGVKLDFKMSSTPNKKRGIKKEDFPYSYSMK